LVPTRIWPYAGGALSLGYFYPVTWNSFGTWPYASPTGPPAFAPDDSALDPLDTPLPTGGLRLAVDPKDAEVFVDGYFAGTVDDFDGPFQHLDLPVGPHHVEIRAASYEPLVVDVSIQAHHTTVYRGALVREPR
jgi:hypothetical protein